MDQTWQVQYIHIRLNILYTGNLASNFCMEKQTKFSPVGSVKKKKKGENGSIKRPYGFTAAQERATTLCMRDGVLLSSLETLSKDALSKDLWTDLTILITLLEVFQGSSFPLSLVPMQCYIQSDLKKIAYAFTYIFWQVFSNCITVRAGIQGPSLIQDPTNKIQIKDPCRKKTVLYKTLSNTRPAKIFQYKTPFRMVWST